MSAINHPYFIWPIFLICLALPFTGCLGRRSWFLDFFSHFRPQWNILIFFGVVYLLFERDYVKAIVLFAVLAGSVLSLIARTSCCQEYEGYSPVNSLRILLANVYAHNRKHEKIIKLIQRENPDILVLEEINQRWGDYLAQSLKDYPHREICSQDGFFGLAVFSKLPLKEIERVSFVSERVPSIRCVFEWEGHEIVLWATHPKSPRRRKNWKSRNKQLMELSKRVDEDRRPTIVAGDLNASPWCGWFRELLGKRLVSAAVTGDIRGTWPAFLPSLFRTGLDHVLVNSGFDVEQYRILEKIGSDHLPVLVCVSISLNT